MNNFVFYVSIPLEVQGAMIAGSKISATLPKMYAKYPDNGG